MERQGTPAPWSALTAARPEAPFESTLVGSSTPTILPSGTLSQNMVPIASECAEIVPIGHAKHGRGITVVDAQIESLVRCLIPYGRLISS
jgi:hypothetical protein